jgi:hypothetical protein
LSQPRRDTADPKKAKSLNFYLLTFTFLFSFSTPCDRAIFSIAGIYPIYNRKATLFHKKYASPRKSAPKTPKKAEKPPLVLFQIQNYVVSVFANNP